MTNNVFFFFKNIYLPKDMYAGYVCYLAEILSPKNRDNNREKELPTYTSDDNELDRILQSPTISSKLMEGMNKRRTDR